MDLTSKIEKPKKLTKVDDSCHDGSTPINSSDIRSSCPVTGQQIELQPTLMSSTAVDESKMEIMPISKSDQSLMALKTMQCYVREFLAKPNENVGRKGPTCPFVPTSLKFDSIYMAALTREEVKSAAEIEQVVTQMIPVFLDIEPRTGPKAPFKAIILVFPDMDEADAGECIDAVQLKLKPLFVEKGLMLGEFHRYNNASGLRNPNFFPLRTPVPSLAIRHMVPSDIAFLNNSEYSAQQRLDMIETYMKNFADKMATGGKDSKELIAAREVIESIKKELPVTQ